MPSSLHAFKCDLHEDFKACSGQKSGIRWVYLFHAGFQALFFYRLARLFHAWQCTNLAKAITAFGRFMTSCDLHYKAKLAGGIILPHGRGVVIGEGVVVERRCSIFQHTSLGSFEGKEGLPYLEEGVNLYAGCVIAGAVRIGEYARIGPNVYVTVSIPKYARVTPALPNVYVKELD